MISEGLHPPDPVPEGARWNADERKWEVCPTDENGRRHGECLLFREEGQLYSRSQFRAGVREGAFAIYHPNGQLARRGSYVADAIEGSVFAYTSDAFTTEHLRGCCVPQNAWELRATYEAGQLTQENFYDRQGRALLDDGTLLPDKPPSVDAAAGFDQSLRRWRLDRPGEVPESRRARFWSSDGSLLEDVEYRPGNVLFSRLFDTDGRVKQECTFVENNQLDGPCLRRFTSDEENPYADRRIREERGRFERGQVVGTWIFLDAHGAVLRTLDRGIPFSEESGFESPVFAEQAMDEESAGPWLSLARELARESRLREALCAAARAAACAGSATQLTTWLEAQTVALLPQEKEQRGQRLMLSPDATLSTTLDALVMGADPAAVFRTLAALATGSGPAARDFIEASLLLAPDRPMSYLTRALVRIELGDDRGSLKDAEQVEKESAAAAGFVRDYARILFAPFSFRAPGDALSSLDSPTMPVALEQPLEAIRRAIQIYATRLALVRTALEKRAVRAPEAPFFPRYLDDLLREGPLELRGFEAVIRDETETGPEETTVRIDEAPEIAGRSVPAILCAARYDHCALSWLCWSVGLDRIALPDRIVERPEFAAAATMAVARFWRAQDRLSTGGLIARSQGIAGFQWEGFDIDTMPQRFAEIAAGEYLELRSLFLWLTSADNLSPFQSDLRS